MSTAGALLAGMVYLEHWEFLPADVHIRSTCLRGHLLNTDKLVAFIFFSDKTCILKVR